MKVSIFAVLFLAAIATLSADEASTDSTLISPSELEALVQQDAAYIVDVRDLMSYLSGHIPGAHAIPLSELPEKIEELSEVERTIVTYCACPAEETSMQAALYLAANGIDNVKVLKGGVREWSDGGTLVRGPRRY